MKRLLFIPLIVCSAATFAADTADFEDLSLAPNSFESGAHLSGSFVSNGYSFNNSYVDYGGGFTSWGGFAYSNIVDKTTKGFGNQYASIAGGGASNSTNYGVVYDSGSGGYGINPTITFPSGVTKLSGVSVTNTTYDYFSMLDGDMFAKKFEYGDWFKLTATGLYGSNITSTASFYLADFRSTNTTDHYILSDWKWFDLSSLGSITSVQFSLSSSDSGEWGMNTPAYFAIDNVTPAPVPEPATLIALGFGLVATASRRRRNNKS